MKKNIIISVILTTFISLSVVFQPITGIAAEENGSTNVSVTTNVPDNQIDKNQSYFDLLMKQGQKQELEVVLRNNTDKDITMLAAVNTAITNDNGVVDYSWDVETALAAAKENNKNPKATPIDEKKIAYDTSLAYPLSIIATIDKEILVPAKSEVISKVAVKMPEKEIPGVIAGGVYLTQKEDTNANTENSKGVQIKNKFVYVVGIQLRQTEDISTLVPELKLDRKKILPTQVNYRNYLGVNLQNIEPVYIRNLTVEAKIYKKGSKELLHETRQEGMKMAPNSNFNFGVNWDNQEFKAGTYQLKMIARADDYEKEWTWDEEFTIEKDLADKLNSKAVELEKTDNSLYYILGGSGLVLLLFILLFFVVKRRIEKKKEEELRRKRAAKRKREKMNKKKQESKIANKNKEKTRKQEK